MGLSVVFSLVAGSLNQQFPKIYAHPLDYICIIWYNK